MALANCPSQLLYTREPDCFIYRVVAAKLCKKERKKKKLNNKKGKHVGLPRLE